MEENLLGRSFKLVPQQLILSKFGRGERGRQLPQDLRCSGQRQSDDESETGFRGIVLSCKSSLVLANNSNMVKQTIVVP